MTELEKAQARYEAIAEQLDAAARKLDQGRELWRRLPDTAETDRLHRKLEIAHDAVMRAKRQEARASAA